MLICVRLDSRQRKKMHTEKLEEEKKQFTSVMTELEDALTDARRNENALHQERGQWQAENQRLQQYIENLHQERDEMIRVHTLETGDLRKRVNILREHLEQLEQQAQYAQPTPDTVPGNVFTNEFNSFDGMNMESQGWDDFTIATQEYKMDTDTIKREPTPIPPSAEIPQPAKPTEATKPTDLPFSWNAFYMCLLFGAFIASNTPSSHTTTSSTSNTAALTNAIPPLPSEYRAESANVLKAVLASANPSKPSTAATTTLTSTQLSQITGGPSQLEHLHNTLALPSRSQSEAAAFSLTPAQYAHITNPDPFLSTSPPLSDTDADGDFDLEAAPAPEKDGKQTELQRALAAMRGERDGVGRTVRGEVYERSLLWEMVPEKVVKDFQEMIRRCEEQKDG